MSDGEDSVDVSVKSLILKEKLKLNIDCFHFISIHLIQIEMKEQDVSDDSDDSSDEIEDEDIKRNQQFIDILQKIEQNKYSYDDYVALVDIAQ